MNELGFFMIGFTLGLCCGVAGVVFVSAVISAVDPKPPVMETGQTD